MNEEVKVATDDNDVSMEMGKRMENMFASMNRKEKRDFCKKNGISYKEMFRPVTRSESLTLSTVHDNR